MTKLILMLSFLMLLSISATAQCDQEITVKLGETKTAEASGLRVTLVKVLEDSRCPKGTECIWAGRARIQVTLEAKDADAITVEFATTGDDDQNVDLAGYRIHLVKLDPYPSADAPEDKEYVATFRFENL